MVPVTARLSKLFYDRLGEAVANELVDWFNQVDATYRSDLREMNELNYARFESKLEQRLAELRAELKAELLGLEGRLEARMIVRAESLESRLDGKIERLGIRLDSGLREQGRFLYLALAAQLAATLSLWLR
jgi:hypothetical protein